MQLFVNNIKNVEFCRSNLIKNYNIDNQNSKIMKNLFLFALTIVLFIGCKKDNHIPTLVISVKFKNTATYTTNPSVSGADVYLFKKEKSIFNEVDTYTYCGNGIVRSQGVSGSNTIVEDIYPSQHILTVNGSIVFTGLASGNYFIVVDISHLDTAHKVTDSQLRSFIIPDPNFLNNYEFIFDISPYSVNDFGL